MAALSILPGRIKRSETFSGRTTPGTKTLLEELTNTLRKHDIRVNGGSEIGESTALIFPWEYITESKNKSELLELLLITFFQFKHTNGERIHPDLFREIVEETLNNGNLGHR